MPTSAGGTSFDYLTRMTMLIASAAFLLGGIATLLGVAKLVFEPKAGNREQADSEAVRHVTAA